MALQRTKREAKLPPCAACDSPGTHGFWDQWLCGSCFAAWSVAAPPLAPLELAHAEAHPKDVDLRGEFRYLPIGETERRWVVLKPGVLEKLARNAATAWVLQQRNARAA